MTDFRILNGNGQKVTIIETFRNHALLISPGQRLEFESLKEARDHVDSQGLQINISHIFGSSIKREMQNGGV